MLAAAPLAGGSGGLSAAHPLRLASGEVVGTYVVTSNGLEATLANESSGLTFYYNAGKLADGRPVTSATFNGAPCTSSVPAGWSFDCGPYQFGPGQTAKLDVVVSGLSPLVSGGVADPDLLLEFSANQQTYDYPADIPKGSGGAPPPPPPPPPRPPAPPSCKCAGVEIATAPINFTDDRNFEFEIDWTIHCTGGAGTCRGEIDSLPPLVETPPGLAGTDLVIAKNRQVLHCAGRCGRLSRGTFYIIGRSARQWERKARAGHTFVFQFQLWCADPGQRRVNLGKRQIKVVFDKRGFLDRKSSTFKNPAKP